MLKMGMVLVVACACAPHSVAILPLPLGGLAGRRLSCQSSRAGRAGCAVCCFRAGLGDRPADVQRVRDASAGFLGEMLGAAVAETRRQRARRAADAPMERAKRCVGILAAESMDYVAWDVARGLRRCEVQIVGGVSAHGGGSPLWRLENEFPGLVCSRPPPLLFAMNYCKSLAFAARILRDSLPIPLDLCRAHLHHPNGSDSTSASLAPGLSQEATTSWSSPANPRCGARPAASQIRVAFVLR